MSSYFSMCFKNITLYAALELIENIDHYKLFEKSIYMMSLWAAHYQVINIPNWHFAHIAVSEPGVFYATLIRYMLKLSAKSKKQKQLIQSK